MTSGNTNLQHQQSKSYSLKFGCPCRATAWRSLVYWLFPLIIGQMIANYDIGNCYQYISTRLNCSNLPIVHQNSTLLFQFLSVNL